MHVALPLMHEEMCIISILFGKISRNISLHCCISMYFSQNFQISKQAPGSHKCCSIPMSGYTREKIRNLNDHCNDDCNSSLEWSDLTHERKFVTWMIIVMMIAMRLSSLECEFSRGRTNSYINTRAHKYKGHVSSAAQKMIWMFLRTHAKFSL